MSSLPIPKMTANAPPDGKWSCEVCTYENFPLSRKCTMCLSPCPLPLPPGVIDCMAAPTEHTEREAAPTRPAAGGAAPPHCEAAPRAPSRAPSPDNASATGPQPAEAAALTPCESEAEADTDAVAERLRPLRIAEPKIQPKWACQTCTYENWPRALRCAMCGGRGNSPGAAGHPPPAAASPRHSPPPPDRHAHSDRHNSGGEWQPRGENDERRKRRTNVDWLWLQACIGVVENRMGAVQAYLSRGGDPTRALSAAECQRLARPSAFDVGYTLVHLAIRFQRSEILSAVLSRIGGSGSGLKRSASFAAPELAALLRRHAAAAVRPPPHRAAPAPYLADFPTFALPHEIESLPPAVQEQLFSELLDQDSQQQLEEDPPAINWSHEVTVRLGSRLYALWNRSLGDCLPDAVSQCLYGVFDRVGWVRRALVDTLSHSSRALYSRWAQWERHQASDPQASYCPTEAQLRAEWCRLVSAAGRRGGALSQLHVFALAQLLRRPLLLYGVRLVRSGTGSGEPLGYARFQGLYLPLLWQPEQCSKCPLVLGYSRGHFCALVALQPPPARYIVNAGYERCVYLPLVECGGEPLEVPFAAGGEPAEAALAARWLAVERVRGVPCARLPLPPAPLLVGQMLEEWLNHYRRIAQQTRGPFPPRLVTDYCSDNGTDDE